MVPPSCEASIAGCSPALKTHLWRQVASTPFSRFSDLLPALGILALIAACGFGLQITTTTQEAMESLPALGGILQLMGVTSLLGFLSRQALRQQKLAELAVRIEVLRRDFIG
jgi:flagellar motor component MotA